MRLGDHLTICLRCPHRAPRDGGGIIRCTLNGQHYIDNAKAGECPDGRFRGAPPPSVVTTAAVPRDKWPLAARIIAKLAATEDKGVGDTVSRVIDPLGGELFKRWYRRITGSDCGCADRQGRLNAMYPYRVE